MKIRVRGFLCTAVFTVASLASGQASLFLSGPIKGTPASVRVTLASLLVEKDRQGQEKLILVHENVHPRPGDLLAWKFTAINDFDRSMSNLVLTIPIPVGTDYVDGSALLRLNTLNVAPLYSVDGQSFAPAPLKRKVRVTQNGVTSFQDILVPLNEYRAVRWVVPTLTGHGQAVAEVRTNVR